MTIALRCWVRARGGWGLRALCGGILADLPADGDVHFAFGDLVGLGIFATLLVLAGTTPVTQSGAPSRGSWRAHRRARLLRPPGSPPMSASCSLTCARGSTIGWVAGTAAVAFAIRAAIGATFQRSSYVFPDPLPFHASAAGIHSDRRRPGAGAGLLCDRPGGGSRAGFGVAPGAHAVWPGAARGGRRRRGRPLRGRARRAVGRARVRPCRRARDDRRDRRCSGRGGQREHRHPARAEGARRGARRPVRAAVVAFVAGLVLGVVERPSPTSTSGAGSSGPRIARCCRSRSSCS